MSNQKKGEKSPAPNGATPSLPIVQDAVSTTLYAGSDPHNSLAFTTSNLPNAAKVISSMRHLGYNNYAAIKDICDNSSDALALLIRILIEPESKGSYSITIVDNGNGMNFQILDQALRLGSDTERDEMSDLGKFGMGLVTASLSICRRVEVITKEKNGPILYSVQDVDEVINKNDFVKHLGVAGTAEERLFQALLPNDDHGTIVRLTRCDHLQNKDAKSFANRLRKELGQTFRYFLRSDQKQMWVNAERVMPVDPMMMAEGAEEYSRETYNIDYTDEDGVTHKEQFEMRLVKLPNFDQKKSSEIGINIPNQGIYLLRNYREIAAGETFSLFNKHNDLNRFRAEIFVPGTLDELIGVDFTKQKPNFKQAFSDKVNQQLKSQISAIRSQLKGQRVLVESDMASHDEAVRQIGQKSHLLLKPKLDIEKRSSRTDSQPRQKKEADRTKERTNLTKTQKKELALPCRFKIASMTSAGPIWDAHPEGKTLVITWNIDHPFYQRFILDNQDNPSMITATDFLVYSFCAAELVFGDDDDEDSYEKRQAMIENIRATLSNNMRQLLS